MTDPSLAEGGDATTIEAFDAGVIERRGGESQPIEGFVLRHPSGVEATIVTYGAHLVSVRVPDTRHPGTRVSITRGPADVAALQTVSGRFMGATVGRVANRIGGAAFDLDGQRYELEANEPPNHLHGGTNGFHHRVWQSEILGPGLGVRLTLLSAAGEGGYPGTVDAAATFRLGDHTLDIHYTATADAPTPLSLTNHTYWNLAGVEGETIGEHQLHVGFDRVLLTDAEGLPVPGPPVSVAGTRFEMNGDTMLAATLAGGGLDHCYVTSEPFDRPVLELSHARTGRSISLTTNQLGIQVYTGNKLDPAYHAIAFEPQSWPNSPNRADFPSSVLRPGETYSNHSTYRFDW